jgi:hypothetical protein
MEVSRVKLSYHRPGETGLLIYCIGPGVKRNVRVKALMIFWLMLLLVSLPIAAAAVILISRLVAPGRL